MTNEKTDAMRTMIVAGKTWRLHAETSCFIAHEATSPEDSDSAVDPRSALGQMCDRALSVPARNPIVRVRLDDLRASLLTVPVDPFAPPSSVSAPCYFGGVAMDATLLLKVLDGAKTKTGTAGLRYLHGAAPSILILGDSWRALVMVVVQPWEKLPKVIHEVLAQPPRWKFYLAVRESLAKRALPRPTGLALKDAPDDAFLVLVPGGYYGTWLWAQSARSEAVKRYGHTIAWEVRAVGELGKGNP